MTGTLDLLVSVSSPGDSHWQPKYKLAITAAITQASLRKASEDDDVVTYVVTGGIMGEEVACPYLWPEGRPDISGRDLYGYFPTLRPYKPDGQNERLVFISHQHIEREIRFTREGQTKVSHAGIEAEGLCVDIYVHRSSFFRNQPTHAQGMFIKSLRHLPLAMGYAPFGGTGTLGDVEEVRVVGEAPLSFEQGGAVPFLGQYFPEVRTFLLSACCVRCVCLVRVRW